MKRFAAWLPRSAIVVLGRQQLSTENTLTPILPLLHNRDLGTLGSVLRLWVLVLASNIAGTWAVGSVLAHTSIFEPRILDAYVVALGEFAHIIAGSVECAFLVQSGRASLTQYAFDFFLPTLLGNILGGTTLVALLNYGQVAAEIDDHRE
ncbi:formate/nitrite transporter family protein [Bradyrhizobium sp. RDM4]|uniref:formate/nitrite transporter family protein n=1 Tax=Bradyrhizobium sp. RDM4 TaxID=3378765 RepID=UPI0038FBFF27